jgi:hypothetical protein
VTTPFRIAVNAVCTASLEQLRAQATQNIDHPLLERAAPSGRRLAIVGGGPSVAERLDELRAWDGDVWGINYTAKWLNERGVRATLFTVDPGEFAADGVPNAILSQVCAPSVFEQLRGRVRAFVPIEVREDGLSGGVTSATRAPSVSFYLGYLDVSFFGCEGSFAEASHVDRDATPSDQVIVRAGGNDYRTCLEFMVQSEQLATLIKTFPDVYHDRSGGLLAAMIDNLDTWEIVAVSASMKRHLEEHNGSQGLYENVYVQPQAA